MLYFFLSYAREDDPEYIRRFFHDLSSQVRNLAGVGMEDEVGFLDELNVQLGQRWSAELTDALASCGSFIAMTSPRYFRRDYCGREWYVFSDRLATYQRRWNRLAPALLPVRWIPANPMHPLAAEIQSANAGLGGPSYLQYGLRQMLDLKRFRDDYREFVFQLARRIVTVTDTHKVPRQHAPVSVDLVPNAFSAGPAIEPTVEPTAVTTSMAFSHPFSRPTGARLSARTLVHFVVVAGTRDQMSAIRTKLDYYGSLHEGWAPYHPELQATLADFATQIAGDRLFDSDIADISRLEERVDQAKRQNEVIVLLVDAWSPGLSDHRRALTDYDARDDLTSAVMIPFSSTDAETLSDTTVLQAQLAQVLRHNLDRRDRMMLRQNIPTPEQFGTDLEEILEVAQNRIFKKGIVNPLVPDRPSRPRPILEGPTSTMDGYLS